MEKFENLIQYNGLYLDELVNNINDYITYNNDIIIKNIEFSDIILFNASIANINNTRSVIIGRNRSTSDNTHKYIFHDCIFLGELNLHNDIKRTLIFENCTFNNITLEGMKKNSTVDNIQNGFILKNIKSIKNLTIDSCEFYEKFYINKEDDEISNQLNIEKLIIKNTIFKNNFKLHNSKIDKILIKDIDFEKNADFFKSKFIKGIDENDIYFKSINFRGLALFGDTEFFQKLIYKYVTFEGHNHFKSAILHKGLDLEYTNIQKEINFYGMEILDKTTTSQETYRIIKNQFEKLNNKIEANKYHALELEKKRVELEKEPFKNWKEYIVFKLHDLSSEHSTNWFRVLLWIFILGSFSTMLSISLKFLLLVPIMYFIFQLTIVLSYNFDYRLLTITSICLSIVIFDVDTVFKYINIISSINDFNKSYFEMTLNKVSLGYLYYQFLTAVRKDTRK